MIDRRAFLSAPLALAFGAAPPNLLLITASGWRGMATPWEGDVHLRAPNLAAFGKQSIVFARTYCASPKPELGQLALLTAKFPHAAKLSDPRLGNLVEATAEGAMSAFGKAPFAVRIALPASGVAAGDAAAVHPRGNVPPRMEAAARKELAVFYASCRARDRVLGEILAALEKRNVAGDTVVCFTSDCGQQMGSQGMDGGEVAFEESVRIPLAIRYPRKLKPEIRGLASQVDILPTLLALSGAEIPEGAQGRNLFGPAPREVAFAEGKMGTAEEWRMLVRGYDKLVATPKGEALHLFNLTADPLELNDQARAADQRLRLASLKAQLLAEQKALGDGLDRSGLRIR